MSIYIALLRGINVGGKNIIKMAELKRVLEAIGLYDVKTYIQSGNVLFKSNEAEDALRREIEHEIEAIWGFAVTVILRTSVELERIIQNCPFSEEEKSETGSLSKKESLYVSLMTQTPAKAKIDCLNPYKSESEEYQVVGREVFLLFRQSIRNSKLANNLQKLDAQGTVRNWRTINKLLELAKAMQI